MAPLPDNNTKRYWLDYTTGITEHSMMVRLAGSTSHATAISFYADFLVSLQALLSDEFGVLRVRMANAGSNVALPIDAGTLTGFHGTDTDAPDPVDTPKELIFVGRGDDTGRKWRLSLYGAQVGFPADYRYEGVGLLPSMGAAINVVNDYSELLVTVGGDSFTCYPYVNINNNSYWERQARRA